MLAEFIRLNRDEIIGRCRSKVAQRSIPPPTDAEIDHGVPRFLDQLVEVLGSADGASADIDRIAGHHGHDLLLKGFTVSQVVHDYGDVCQSITELAVETSAPFSTEDFHTLNRCLDDAIASAVTTYSRERQQSDDDAATERGHEQLGFFVHELRNLVNTAMVAFEVLQSGNVGVAGSTGSVLKRSLRGLHELIARSLDEVRLIGGATNRALIPVAELIQSVALAARLAAGARGITLDVRSVPDGLSIEADRHILEAVIGNLLQNAFKFTRADSTVTVCVSASADRVLIEVEDECGGLPGGDVNDLFRPFEQRGADRSGLGIGLGFSRWGAEANGGRLYARDLPGRGCVFVLDLPRFVAPVPISG